MSGFHLGQVPFKKVLIHGLVRAKDGRKFSKSLNNGVDPIDMVEKYGADALRMGLIVGTPIGNDIKFDESKVKAYKLFANKLWNITRFILSSTENMSREEPDLTPEDERAINELSQLTQDITKDIEQYNIHLASEKLYHYVWHTLADTLLEERKEILAGEDTPAKQSAQWTLYTILTTSLKLLHPFMPFITEEIWQSLPERQHDMLLITPWPQSDQ